MNDITDDYLYESLKNQLINSNYSSSSLIQKAKFLRTHTYCYDLKIFEIIDYLIDKIKNGDYISYALIYASYEEKMKDIFMNINQEKFYIYIDNYSTLHILLIQKYLNIYTIQ